MKDNIKNRISYILLEEEENANTLAFIVGMTIAIGAVVGVQGFLDGSNRDWSMLVIPLSGYAVHVFGKKVKWFKKYVKYEHILMPFIVNCALVISRDGKYAASTQVYFLCLMLTIAYCDVKMVFASSAAMILSTVGAFIISPEAMLSLDNAVVWVYILLVYLLATAVAAIIAYRMRRLLEEAREKKIYEDELIYLEQLEKKEEQYREFVHNINHYFNAIGEMARTENCENIVSMVEELNGKLLQNERIIYTNHKVLNAILSEKASEAEEKQISYEAYVEPGVHLHNVESGDLVSMLGNLLDNALEAAGKCEGTKRKVSVGIYMEKDGKVCVVKIANYFAQPPVRHKADFVSTKKEKGIHGIGIKSVRKTAEKYGGYLQCLIGDDVFSAILILPTQNDKK